MIDRLASLFYWLGIILAALLLAFAIKGVVTAPSGVDPFELAILQAGLAAFVYGFGWIIRYVLTGRRGFAMTTVNRVGFEAAALLPDLFEEMFSGLNELLGVAVE